jgi:hypothetical protein
MKRRVLSAHIAAIALTAATSLNPALAQSGVPGLYAYHTGPVVGGCPGLDWHVTLEPGGHLVGFVAWDQGAHLAKLDGSIDKSGAFQMDANEVGGAARKAAIKGKAAGSTINVVIEGSGTPCDGVNLAIPRVVGGLGGGGG